MTVDNIFAGVAELSWIYLELAVEGNVKAKSLPQICLGVVTTLVLSRSFSFINIVHRPCTVSVVLSGVLHSLEADVYKKLPKV